MQNFITTYNFHIEHQDAIWEASKESAALYNDAIRLNQDGIKPKQAMKSLDVQSKESKYLQSQSAQAAYQDFFKDLSTYFKSLKDYRRNPKKYKKQPNPPHRIRQLKPITFKKSAIHVKDGYLLLSLRKPNEPLKFRWGLQKPIWVLISFDPCTGWKMSCVLEKKCRQYKLNPKKILGVDLGSKRIATTFDGKECITYSGKLIKSLIRLQNKCGARSKTNVAGLKKNSRKYRRIMRARRKITNRINNRKKDILHKTSRAIVNNAIKHRIGIIVFGDCGDIHDGTNLGKSNNQQVQQCPEQKLRKYVSYKFERVGGVTGLTSESYTSQNCPICSHRNKPKGRNYRCSDCSYKYDRDGVGCINIHTNAKVSFGLKKTSLDVVGGLTPPRGWKYHPQLPLKP